MAPLFSHAERRAILPRADILPADWADANRVLTRDSSPEPGPYRTGRTPYLRDPMNAFANPVVREITVVKCTQSGGTDMMFNLLGYCVDVAPGPAIYTMPRDDDANHLIHQRFKNTVEASPGFQRHLTRNWLRLSELLCLFDTMPLYLAGANSPAALASKPCLYAFNDETDKYPRYSGREADPISLVRERTTNFPDRKLVKISTPTFVHGYIWQEWLRSLQHRFFVPCPQCGHFQVMIFPQVKFPTNERDPDRIEAEQLAHYECEKCQGVITDAHKPTMLLKGRWLTPNQLIDPDGTVHGEARAASHVGYHITAMMSPWRTFSGIAAEFLRSKDRPEKLMSWRNSWVAEPFVERQVAVTHERLLTHIEAYPRAKVPTGAQVLTAGVDVHGPNKPFHVVIRGWGEAEESWLVLAARAETWQGVESLLCTTLYPPADAKGDPYRVLCAAIDSGYRTAEVYDFCRAHADTCRAIKGQPGRRMTAPWKPSRIDYTIAGRHAALSLMVWHLDVDYFKDVLARMIAVAPGDPGYWHLHAEVTKDYLEQLTSEHKALKRDTKGRPTEEWELVQPGADNHFWDAEVYATAAADMIGARNLGPIVPGPAVRRERAQPAFIQTGDWWGH